jgi:hypothetical protein
MLFQMRPCRIAPSKRHSRPSVVLKKRRNSFSAALKARTASRELFRHSSSIRPSTLNDAARVLSRTSELHATRWLSEWCENLD